MNSIKYAKAMKEVTEYLKGIRKEDLDKIPEDIINFLHENQAKDYECKFDYTVSLKDMEIMEETKGIILYLCYNYWCESEKEKQGLLKKLNENEIKFQEELKKQFEISDTLNKTKKETQPIKSEEIAEIKRKTSVFTKILEFFKKIAKKK